MKNRTESIGSIPRPLELIEGMQAHALGRLDEKGLNKLFDAALIDEMLKQRRYSFFFEGHRWLDIRRYDRLATLPIDRPNDDVWSSFPLPSTE